MEAGQLNETLAPLASDRVTTVIGFTEVDRAGRLYNSAAVLCRGSVVGLYRKLRPALNKSVYSAGDATLVFTVIRADVAGRAGDLVSYGSTSVVDAGGRVVATARELVPELIVADIATSATTSRPIA